MSRISQKPSDHLLLGGFSLEDLVNMSEEDILLLVELDPELGKAPPPQDEKTAAERQFEQRLRARLVTSHN